MEVSSHSKVQSNTARHSSAPVDRLTIPRGNTIFVQRAELPAGLESFDFEQAKNVLGSSLDAEKFARVADDFGRVSKDLLEVAVADFGTMRSVPDMPELDLEQAKAVLGNNFNPEMFARAANEAGKVRGVRSRSVHLEDDGFERKRSTSPCRVVVRVP